MRILYGVVGEGMGHATRSRVILEHLLNSGHQVRVVVSGRAHRFLTERLSHHSRLTVEEIHGISLQYAGNRLQKGKTLTSNLRAMPAGMRKNYKVYRKVAEDGFRPELVVSDFESWAGFYALNKFLPMVSIDNMQIINRCKHVKSVVKGKGFDYRIAKLAVRYKIPGAYHYLITSFFFPEVKKKRTTLVPPVLRPELIEAKREPGKHVLVYQTAATNEKLMEALKKLPYEFRVYGMHREGDDKNLHYRAFSETGFIDDLRTARAVIAGGGFSLLSEAVTLHVPLLSIPVEAQWEQELNARYLQHLGYGMWARELDLDLIEQFVERSDEFAHSLESYERRDNSMLFNCLDELIERRAAGEKRPVRLDTDAMGKYGDED